MKISLKLEDVDLGTLRELVKIIGEDKILMSPPLIPPDAVGGKTGSKPQTLEAETVNPPTPPLRYNGGKLVASPETIKSELQTVKKETVEEKRTNKTLMSPPLIPPDAVGGKTDTKPQTVEEKPQVIKEEAKVEEKAVDVPKGPSIEEVRSEILKFCRKDRANKNKIQDCFNELGVASLSEVKPSDYNKLLEVVKNG